MSDWIKIGVEFIKALPGQWKGSSDPNAPSEIVDTRAEEAPRVNSVARATTAARQSLAAMDLFVAPTIGLRSMR